MENVNYESLSKEELLEIYKMLDDFKKYLEKTLNEVEIKGEEK